MTQLMRDHVERMLSGQITTGATLYLGEEVIESATGRSRGGGSISVLGIEGALLVINDEARGRRGTARKEDLYRVLDEEERLAAQEGRTLRFEAGSRDRRAMWQELNDDAGRK